MKKGSNLSQLNKKAESTMVGYVLLIAIAVALATAVFFYLKLYLPDERAECSLDINLVIDSVRCVYNPVSGSPTSSTVYVNITNKGFFSVDGAYIKIGDEDRILRESLNSPEEGFNSTCNNYSSILLPDASFCGSYSYGDAPNKVQEFSIEPLIWIDNKPVICPESIVRKKIPCTI